MQPADRRFIQISIAAWVMIYAWMVVRILSEVGPLGIEWALVAVGLVSLAMVAAMLTAVVVAIPLRIAINLALKDRRRSHRSETIGLALLLVLVAAYFFEVERERNGLAPPAGVATLSAFAEEMPPPQWIELYEHDDREYIAWTGELSGPFDVPSGPSCYLFDSSGQLIDWQPETGDGGPVEALLGSSENRKQLTLDEALQVTRKRANPVRVDEM